MKNMKKNPLWWIGKLPGKLFALSIFPSCLELQILSIQFSVGMDGMSISTHQRRLFNMIQKRTNKAKRSFKGLVKAVSLFLLRTFPNSMSPSPAFMFLILEEIQLLSYARADSLKWPLCDGDLHGKTSECLEKSIEKREFLYGLEERQNSQLKLQPQQRHAASNHGKKSVKQQSWKKRGE